MKLLTILIALFVGIIASPNAYAQDGEVIYKEKTEIDFEALDIEGQLKKPRMKSLGGTSGAIFNSLIQPRTDFIGEMEDSLDDIE